MSQTEASKLPLPVRQGQESRRASPAGMLLAETYSVLHGRRRRFGYFHGYFH